MKLENIGLALEINNDLRAIESVLKDGKFDTTYQATIIRAVVSVGFMKIKPLLEERRVELQRKIEEL